MASRSSRKSGSSGSSRRPASSARASRTSAPRASRTSAPRAQRSSRASSPRPESFRAIPGGRIPHSQEGAFRQASVSSSRYQSKSVGDIERRARAERTRATYRRHLIRVGIALACVAALVVGGVALYFSSAFSIESVQVEGVEHLTESDMQALVSVPEGETLLRVDTHAIEQSLMRDAWVKSVTVNRVFPNTLQIVVTERTVAAVVEVPTSDAKSTQDWAIASDGMWLMAIPDRTTALGQSLNQRIYEDADSVLRITDVPYGTSPETGTYCSDGNVNNALSIVSGMTTELAGQVKTVSATDAESTKLTLESGVEIAFGPAENVRDKERVCLQILEQNPGKVAYINVRVVDRPTWRSL